MAEQTPGKSNRAPGPKKGNDARADRLKAALKANMAKRKAQARARADGTSDTDTDTNKT